MGHEWGRITIDGVEFGHDITGWLPKTPGRGLDLERVRLLAWSHIGGDREAVRVTWEDAFARVSVSLPPSTPAWIAASIENAILCELPAFATVGVFVRKPPEMEFSITFTGAPDIDKIARDLESIVSRAKTPTTHASTYDLAAYGIKPIPVVTCPDCGSAWSVSQTTCDGDACVTKRARARREAQRREIDAVLCEDARRFPAFATARKCAVMAAFEDVEHAPKLHVDTTAELCSMLREYESKRGGMGVPKAGAPDAIEEWGARFAVRGIARDLVASYERARRLM